MNVNLTPTLEKLVQSKVATGRYNSASEVVREALRLLEERDQIHQHRLASFKSKIRAGLNSLDDGRSMDGATFFKSLENAERTVSTRRKKRA